MALTVAATKRLHCPHLLTTTTTTRTPSPHVRVRRPPLRLHAGVWSVHPSREMSGPAPSPDLSFSVDKSGSDVVREFYAGINRRDLDFVRDLIAEDCVYEDLVFPRPFSGRQAILEFFSKFTDAVGSDLQFVIDDISSEDPVCVGVTWHLDMDVIVWSLQ